VQRPPSRFPADPLNLDIALLLAQDGLTNGAIYALLALALVLVFAVTRVIFVPQGEFVAYGALTLASLQLGKVPGTAWQPIASPSRSQSNHNIST
jgi:branched-chain amino acid transport system permease protein